MAKLPRLTPQEAEKMLLKAGLKWSEAKAVKDIYERGEENSCSISSREDVTSKGGQTSTKEYRD